MEGAVAYQASHVDVGIDINIDSCQRSFDQRSSASALLRSGTASLQHRSVSVLFRLGVLFLAQIVYGSLEVLKTIEILIHAGESQVGDLIELP